MRREPDIAVLKVGVLNAPEADSTRQWRSFCIDPERFAVAQDDRRDDPPLTTTPTRGMSGKRDECMPGDGKVSRRDLLLQTAAGSLAAAGAVATVPASAGAQTSGGGAMKPNIVFILADD